MLLDASAMVAIIAREPGWERLAKAVDNAPDRATTPIAIFEAALALARIFTVTPAGADATVRHFLDSSRVKVIPFEERHAWLALSAHHRFGKGRHPAKLNLGDCFAYAAAQESGRALLCIGDDFGQTDIAVATA